MLTIRTRTFKSDDSADIALSKLDWKVEKVKRLTNPFLSHATADTAKPWVGKIDRDARSFEITQTAPIFSPVFFKGNFFQVYVHGQVFNNGQKSKVRLSFKPRLNTTLLFTLIYLVPVLVTVTTVTRGNGDWKDLLFGLVVPLLFTLLLIFQLNRTENKLIDLFEF